MKRILVFSALIVCCLTVLAQQNLEDVIYLKSGKVVRGQILEQNLEEVKIQILGKYKFIYQQTEIEKIVKEPATSKPTTSNSSASKTASYYKVKEEKPVSPNGYIGIVELGYGVGIGDFGMDYLKVNFINGYRINETFSVGVGLGYRTYDDVKFFDSGSNFYPELYDYSLIPVFLDVRVNLLKGKVSPYIVLDGGIVFDSVFESLGPMFSPGVGAKFGLGRKSALHVGVSYDGYKIPFFNFETFESTEEFSNAVSFNVSISF